MGAEELSLPGSPQALEISLSTTGSILGSSAVPRMGLQGPSWKSVFWSHPPVCNASCWEYKGVYKVQSDYRPRG